MTMAPFATPLAKPDDHVSALTDVLFGHDRAVIHEPWRRLVSGGLFSRGIGLDTTGRIALSYARLRAVSDSLPAGDDLSLDPRRLASLHEWTAAADPATSTIAGIHFNLFLGSLVDHDADPRRELTDFRTMRRVGTFLCTELAHGNDVIAMETEATFDRTTSEFVLHTPSAGARKFMPNTSLIGGPKSAVVAARLKMDGEDHGVFLFLTPLSDEQGYLPGVEVVALPERAGSPIDHCLTSFTRVRLPRAALLESEHGRIDEDGTFSSAYGSHRRRVLRSIARVTTGKLCLSASALGGIRVALAATVKHAHYRTIAGPKAGTRLPLAALRSHHAPLVTAAANVYAMTLLHRRAEGALAADGAAIRPETERLAAIAKAWITWQGKSVLAECRERCGAQGLLLVNRIAELAADLEGAITAEGDNLVIFAKASAEMLFDSDRTASTAPTSPDAAREWTSVDFLRDLVAALARIWHARAHAALRQGKRIDSTQRWNNAVNPALAATEAYARMLATDALLSAANQVSNVDTRELLRRLCRLFVLDYLSRHTGDLLANGHLTSDHVNSLHEATNDLFEILSPHLPALTAAFDIPAGILAAIPLTRTPYEDQFPT